ncbi:hypothetical protein [Enemella sp. A6]|uniref:hypothetical protein n=1 Tax=Enemella sp. A6 TaxID=3440152 RepID=UPI003EBA6AFC
MNKTVAERLVVRPNHRVWVSAWAPELGRRLLSPLPSGAIFVDDLSPEVDVAVLFINSRAEFDAIWLAQSEPLAERPAVWVCYPTAKAQSGKKTITGDGLWAALTPFAWRPVSTVELDANWSAALVRPMNRAELSAAEPDKLIAGNRKAIAAVLEADSSS